MPRLRKRVLKSVYITLDSGKRNAWPEINNFAQFVSIFRINAFLEKLKRDIVYKIVRIEADKSLYYISTAAQICYNYGTEMARKKKGKRKIGEKKIKNISLAILEFILKIPAGVADGFLNQKALYDTYHSRNTFTGEISTWIASLKQRGYIETKIIKRERCIRLTNKAKIKLLDKISDSLQGDKKFRFVSFDIPEDLRYARNKFRSAIKRMGFIRVQDSLWVINKNVAEFVEMAAYEYKVEKYIAYIISEKSDIDGLIKKMIDKIEKKNPKINL